MILENYKKITLEIGNVAQQCNRDPKDISLVVVTKNHSWHEALPLYENGHRDFGENRLQEAQAKIEEAPQDVQWHFIGTLQKNKVKKVVENFALIHSVDTPELAKKISEVSEESGKTSKIILQVNTSGELSKHGLDPDEWRKVYSQVKNLPFLEIQGLMTMAPFVEDDKVIRSCFSKLREFRDELQLEHLSMGMTHDYKIAIEEGATILRLGTAIFEN